MKKIVIIYGTKNDAAPDTAALLAKILREKYSFEVDVFDAKKTKGKLNLDEYENIIIGSSIFCGHWIKDAEKFLKNDLNSKKVAIFISVPGVPGDTTLKSEEILKKYIDDILAEKSKIAPITKKVFGGRVRILGKTVVDNWDPSVIESWAEELGQIFA